MAALAIGQLAAPLDRSLLHIFVAGPGYGEGIAIALPEQGWLLLDGCETRNGELPLQAIMDAWRDPAEPVEALLLTHPHTDHAFGVRDMLETVKPTRIGVTTSSTSPELIFRAVEAAVGVASPLDRRSKRVVLDAMLAVRRRYDAAPHDLLPLVDGATIPVRARGVHVHVRAPEAAIVHARLSTGRIANPNELSAVVEVEFGATRIVLGSDLPTLDASGRVVLSGWNTVMVRHPHLGDHQGLKIPHHGSPSAFHPALMTAGAGRAWWISPFNRGKRLPPTTPDGISRLIALNQQVSLTATPRRRDDQPWLAEPGIVPLTDLPALFAPSVSAGAAGFVVTPPELEPLDPVWCVALDDQGVLRGSWRGPRAFMIVP